MNVLTRLVILILVSAVLSACGGGSGSDSKVPTPGQAPDPVSEPTPDPTPEPTPDPTPEPTPDPIPEPTPDPGHTPSEAAYYKSSIERVIGVLLLVEKAGKSDVKRIPEFVADQVTAHGPTPECDSDCADYYFQVVLPNGQEATVIRFEDINGNSQFDLEEEVLPYMVTDVYGITGSAYTMFDINYGLKMWGVLLGSRYDDQGYGAQIGSTTSILYFGALTIRELGGDRLRIGDYELRPSPTRNIALHVVGPEGQHEAMLETRFTMDTNTGDSDAIVANFDWEVFQGDARESFETLETLDFGVVAERVVLEAGRFRYTQEMLEEQRVVEVSVSGDTAHLFLEIDQDADGVVDSTGYLAQSELSFILP
jgi:hypothetical protein